MTIFKRLGKSARAWWTAMCDPVGWKECRWYVFHVTPKWANGHADTWIAGLSESYFGDTYVFFDCEGPMPYREAAALAEQRRQEYAAWYAEHAPKTGDFL